MEEKQEEKFVQLISKIPNVAVQGYNKNRDVIYWNKASETVYGYTEKEALGKKLEDLIIPDFMKEDVVKGIENWYTNGVEIPAGNLTLVKKDGTPVHLYSSHVMLYENSDNPEMFCIDVDLTEQVKKEEELKERDKILAFQSKMAALGEMLDNIAHQWRQPLSIISTTASGINIKNESNTLDREYLDDSINSIVQTTQYMSHTIEDFRNFVKGTHEKKSFNILDVIKYSLELLDGVFKKNDIKVILLTKSYYIKVFNFPNELVQVLINLITNSKDAFKLNSIDNRLVFIELKEDDKKVFLRVKDNAGGIDEDILPKIFEPYTTTKHKLEGTGIGLYMSYKLINESMNGTIEARNVSYSYDNKEHKGAEFQITIDLD